MQSFRRFSPFAILAIFFVAAIAPAQSDTTALQARLLGKTYFLRSLCAGNNLRFAADGTPIGNCTREPFTLGLLAIDKVEASSSELKIKAHRMGLIFHDDTPQTVDLSNPARGGKPAAVYLRIANPASGDYAAPLSAIFTTAFSDLQPNIPESWQDFVRSHLLTPATTPVSAPQPQPSTQSKGDNRPITQDDIDQAQINPLAHDDLVEAPAGSRRKDDVASNPSAHGVSNLPGKNGVSIPQVIRHRDADFSPEARSMLYGAECIVGLVVDQQGSVERVWVYKPAGLGLDEQALAVVAQYKFKPALKDGKPVEVVMKIAVNFQIF